MLCIEKAVNIFAGEILPPKNIDNRYFRYFQTYFSDFQNALSELRVEDKELLFNLFSPFYHLLFLKQSLPCLEGFPLPELSKKRVFLNFVKILFFLLKPSNAHQLLVSLIVL